MKVIGITQGYAQVEYDVVLQGDEVEILEENPGKLITIADSGRDWADEVELTGCHPCHFGGRIEEVEQDADGETKCKIIVYVD